MPAAEGRPRRLDGWSPVERWLATDPDPDVAAEVVEALMAIQADTWADKYVHLDDVTRKHVVIMYVRGDLVIVWRVITEYPDWFRVIYIGDAPHI